MDKEQAKFDWEEIEPHFTELAVIMGRDFCHWSDIMTFHVSQHGANELQDLIRALTQMRSHIEDVLAPIDEVRYNAREQRNDNIGSIHARNRKHYNIKKRRANKETI